MPTYHVTVEGMVSRVICVDAENEDDAMTYAKADFKSAVGAYDAVAVEVKEDE